MRAATYEQKAGLCLGIDDVMPVEADALEGIPADNGANQAARDEAVKYNEEIADAAFLGITKYILDIHVLVHGLAFMRHS